MPRAKKKDTLPDAVANGTPAASRLAEVAAAAPPKAGIIRIPRPNFQVLSAGIIGISPLICNCFPEKLKLQMRKGRETDTTVQDGTKKGKTPRPARDFEKEFRDSLYPLPKGGYGHPAIAFKHAIVGACRQVSNLDMTLANRIIFVLASAWSKGFACVALEGEPRMREDVVRLAGRDRPPDLRYRGEFFPWSATLTIEFNATMIDTAGILNLLQYAGHCEGVGENRPSSTKCAGDFGRFRVAAMGDD